MKKSLLFLCAIIFLIAVGIAYASILEGRVTAINNDKSSLAVKSRDKTEHVFECDKGVIPNAIGIGDRVKVNFKEEGHKKKATEVRPDFGC